MRPTRFGGEYFRILLGPMLKVLNDLYDAMKSTNFRPNCFYHAQELLASLPAAQPPNRFLLVSMDDDHCGHPVFCVDEGAVRDALASCMYVFDGMHPLNPDNEAILNESLSVLLEAGSLKFEDNPGISLYRLASAPVQPLTGDKA